MYKIPLIRFYPACNDYDRYAFDLDRLHFVFGQPSGEFWSAVVNYYEPFSRTQGPLVKDGKVYFTLEFFLPPNEPRKFDGEKETSSYLTTQDIAYEIYQRRLMEGRFEGVDMSPYMATPGPMTRRLSEPVLMNSDECGFMEELILEGGRFAK